MSFCRRHSIRVLYLGLREKKKKPFARVQYILVHPCVAKSYRIRVFSRVASERVSGGKGGGGQKRINRRRHLAAKETRNIGRNIGTAAVLSLSYSI